MLDKTTQPLPCGLGRVFSDGRALDGIALAADPIRRSPPGWDHASGLRDDSSVLSDRSVAQGCSGGAPEQGLAPAPPAPAGRQTEAAPPAIRGRPRSRPRSPSGAPLSSAPVTPHSSVSLGRTLCAYQAGSDTVWELAPDPSTGNEGAAAARTGPWPPPGTQARSQSLPTGRLSNRTPPTDTRLRGCAASACGRQRLPSQGLPAGVRPRPHAGTRSGGACGAEETPRPRARPQSLWARTPSVGGPRPEDGLKGLQALST